MLETFKVQNIATGKIHRCYIEHPEEKQQSYFVFGPRLRTRGHRYSEKEFHTLYKILPKTKSKTDIWHSHLKRAIQKLEKSGLWPDTILIFKNLLQMSYEEHKDIQNRYFDPNLITDYQTKYPFLFQTETDGTIHIIYDYVAELSDCVLKSMYFGKYQNTKIKEDIKNALINKTPYNTGRIQVGYDVSFDYNPEKRMAWYSEEYRNCGNGHYYIALDENTAVFYEND